ncbi:MAG: M14 family zinc carboxypeptidase [Woeseiaceae bacterium]
MDVASRHGIVGRSLMPENRVSHEKAAILILLFSVFSLRSADADERVRAADAEMFPAGVSYDNEIPTPEIALGHPLGAAPVRHHELVDYLKDLADRSDRITVETIGYSHERRPILFLTITSPENHARIEDLKAEHVALTEPERGQDVRADMPVVTWLNYGVHGAEASGMDAAQRAARSSGCSMRASSSSPRYSTRTGTRNASHGWMHIRARSSMRTRSTSNTTRTGSLRAPTITGST